MFSKTYEFLQLPIDKYGISFRAIFIVFFTAFLFPELNVIICSANAKILLECWHINK